MKNHFSITGGKGFHITLPNGYTVSTQFGPGNYGDHYDCEIGGNQCDLGRIGETCGTVGSNKVEVAAWGPDRKMITLDTEDTVKGYITNEEWWKFVQTIAAREKT